MTAAERRKLTLRELVFEHWHLAALAGVLVTIVSLANQAGPALIDRAITDGMGSPILVHGHLVAGHKDYKTIVVCAVLVLRGDPRELDRPAQPGADDRPAGRPGDERPADQDLHPPPADVARLLHRREGGRDHDPHDERHREPPAAAPRRPGQLRRAGPDDGRDHRHPLHAQRATGDHHRARRGPGAHRPVPLVPRQRPSAATTGCATGSPTCWPTCPRACTGSASSPPTTASATT